MNSHEETRSVSVILTFPNGPEISFHTEITVNYKKSAIESLAESIIDNIPATRSAFEKGQYLFTVRCQQVPDKWKAVCSVSSLSNVSEVRCRILADITHLGCQHQASYFTYHCDVTFNLFLPCSDSKDKAFQMRAQQSVNGEVVYS